jgi:predicted O-methyltransferase YrrM
MTIQYDSVSVVHGPICSASRDIAGKLLRHPQDSAMPKFLTKKPFDFIFIDGWHTFDYTLVDMFYADRLLRIGGYLLIDDALHQGPSKAIAYSNKNYKHWKRITFDSVDVPKTQVLYQKIAEDTKDWDYHVDF